MLKTIVNLVLNLAFIFIFSQNRFKGSFEEYGRTGSEPSHPGIKFVTHIAEFMYVL